MGDENPIRTLGDYSKPSYEGYRNTIKLPAGNNVVPLRSDTIWTRLRLFQFSLPDQASNWLEHLLAGSISTWEDHTTRFLAQFFPPRRTAKLHNNILMFQQHHGESLSEAWTRFKDLLQKSLIIASIVGSKSKSFMIMSPSILRSRLTAQPAANSAIRTSMNLGKSLRTSPSTTMKAGMKQKNSANQSRPFLHLKASQKHLTEDFLSSKTRLTSYKKGPSPQPQALETTFEARVRDYMAAHTERMERFENTIFKQREEINGRMTEMFGLLKELTANRTPEKVLIREETKFPVTKNVKSISLTRNGDEANNKTDGTPDNTKMPTETEMPVRKAKAINGSENRTENESIKTHESDEAVEAYGSQPVAYYLKHKINEKLIKGLVNNSGFNNSRSGTRVGKKKGKEYKILHGGPAYDAILKKKITRKEDISGNFKIPCSIGDLKHVNALVDQGSDVNVMPYSTYMKLTNERLAKTDIRLSLASHSYIYPLGIADDVLVKVAEHVYPVDFMVLDIMENEKRPFILEIPFLTTNKASIKFDTRTITLRSGKGKASPGMGRKDKASLGKGNAVQPMEEQKFQKQAPPLIAIKERMDDEGEVT
ncbi:MAK10-like protein [Tanacetum coccineum]